MQQIIDRLHIQQYQKSTRRSYLSAWRSFNEFYIKLDSKLRHWEDRLVLFVGHLVHTHKQAATIKSYISAIKAVLREDGYVLNEDRYLLNALTKACKLRQNKVKTMLPIQKGLLEIIIKYIKRIFEAQPYLLTMYQALFTATYFGLLRIGEVTLGSHLIKALDVHVADNNRKFKFILRTSKTHTKSCVLQVIKLSSDPVRIHNKQTNRPTVLCPYTALCRYVKARKSCIHEKEPFFVFRDQSAVTPQHMRAVLKEALTKANLDPTFYCVHSIRSGRACDLLHNLKLSLETIKNLGRWRSNAVYNYLKFQ